ncbi:DUF2934 domain-containing protein [Azospirillum sp. TSO22-1]|uniref:DUF2934 domain-containing protein n=1 Tax=Azospirillum sp. TSO22-1 TaxID=716789 RepID=UPI000D6190C3|nr:DUF2934 domain-containing protein [Azospirillum sp. TSO22-1]PWC52812.1 hypothetical protein TSO221_13030 [Azospirillum sp. TSO22-1]
MSQDVEHRIRERAYQIWQDKGCPDGSDHEHWFLAEQEVAAAAPPKSNGKKPAVKKAAPAKAAPTKTAGAGEAPKPAAERKPRARKAAVTA